MSPSSHTVAQDTNNNKNSAITLPPLPPLETGAASADENNNDVAKSSATVNKTDKKSSSKNNNNSSASSSESTCSRIPTKKRSTRSRAICTHPNCTNQVVNNHRCARHGATIKRCSAPQCTNYAQVGGVCTRHGAKKKVKLCKVAGCSNVVRNGGVCRRHGATDARREQMRLEAGLKRKRDGLSTANAKGAESLSSTAATTEDSGGETEVSNSKKATTSNRRRPCSAENCPNTAYIGGVCRRHGAKVKLCSVDGCSNQAKKGGVCFKHRKVMLLNNDDDVSGIGDAAPASTVEDEEPLNMDEAGDDLESELPSVDAANGDDDSNSSEVGTSIDYVSTAAATLPSSSTAANDTIELNSDDSSKGEEIATYDNDNNNASKNIQASNTNNTNIRTERKLDFLQTTTQKT